ncbi:zinc-dependent alcohol dehydrogenase family protein [Ktedonobacter racemifer]|uniref:enoyl-[acyl-carrier-protein] reductase n=1 Tax=Ktedonobacter racemifer DSM 44963 TaxID=485913 RepID=D6TDA0_KTERA|nr:zinc-dependent alcohol dehydrogenase family protein [Ktedonobacter racemifer]EFH88245.1 Alcohol dehydrogenase GroES domain protein [Ktedonobacter racemifer DSM 44963]
MHALQIAILGNPSEVVELVEIPDPDAPGVGEVLVAIEYAPINTSVLLTISGRYGVRPPLPIGVGNEGVGRILSVGEKVDHLQIGDRVLIPTTAPSWRERLVLPAKDLFALPPEADPQQLSMLRINPPTASLLLSEYVALSPGDWVLQNAGNSGVGRWVITFARERGLKTVSVIRRQELIDDLIAAGGDVVLVDGADVASRVAEATGHATISFRKIRRTRSGGLSPTGWGRWADGGHAGPQWRGVVQLARRSRRRVESGPLQEASAIVPGCPFWNETGLPQFW